MTKALVSISEATLAQQPFFVLDGPDGERMPCQWTEFSAGRAIGRRFEVLTPLGGTRCGRIFGVCEDGAFRMQPSHQPNRWDAPLPVDLAWRGDLNSVLDSGHDWCMGADGIEICDHAQDDELIALAAAA